MRLALIPPLDPVYPKLAAPQREIVDLWAEALASEYDWTMRCLTFVLRITGVVRDWSAPAIALPIEVQRLGVVALVTAALEGLGEREVERPEAAVFYALTAHEAWRDAARRILVTRPARRTLARHSGLIEFGRMTKILFEDA